MTLWSEEFVGRSFQEIRPVKSVGEALQRIVRRRIPGNAAKEIEGSWGLDPKTARNVVSGGNVSERTLSKAAQAERWKLWLELGEEMFGETYEQHLRGVIDEYEQRQRRAQAHRDHVRDLETKAARLVGVPDRPAA
jgi:hypothetical protein